MVYFWPSVSDKELIGPQDAIIICEFTGCGCPEITQPKTKFDVPWLNLELVGLDRNAICVPHISGVSEERMEMGYYWTFY